MLQRKGVICFMVAGCMMIHIPYLWKIRMSCFGKWISMSWWSWILISSILSVDGSPRAAIYQGSTWMHA